MPVAVKRPEPAKEEQGFTLIELLIVITIIGILAAIAIPGLLSALNKSKQTSSVANLRQIGQATEVYNGENAMYPVTLLIDEALIHLKPFNENLKDRDEWKNKLGYFSDGNAYTVECFGLDGTPGADVTPQTRYVYTLDIVYSNGSFTATVE
ncbi:prepilin-type N-terminal cleavage/methylation domain-containing protein [Acidobacteriota bacterium]